MADFRQQIPDEVIKASGVAALATDPALVVSLSPNSPIPLPAYVKGGQGSAALPTQAIKDSGRVNVAITCYQAAGIITTEALFAAGTFAVTRDGATPTTVQQVSVSAGKIFSLQSVTVTVKDTAAAAGTAKLALRYNGAGGAITNTSPILALWDIGTAAITAGTYIGPVSFNLPDGMFLIAGSTFGFTSLASAATMLHTITVNGYEF